ncbi:hypothetical protein [Microvirga massiliensis]|uniref:hypothetical protein n=1 Tax=Microvirga massiliensis TaxID=1033741 RepID=UPI00062BB926|nr:hypothetical protein [Microvirga massiliensis]
MIPLMFIGITVGALTIALMPTEWLFAIVAAPMVASLAVLAVGGFLALFGLSSSPDSRRNTGRTASNIVPLAEYRPRGDRRPKPRRDRETYPR